MEKQKESASFDADSLSNPYTKDASPKIGAQWSKSNLEKKEGAYGYAGFAALTQTVETELNLFFWRRAID